MEQNRTSLIAVVPDLGKRRFFMPVVQIWDIRHRASYYSKIFMVAANKYKKHSHEQKSGASLPSHRLA
jgi:hypothetical protein